MSRAVKIIAKIAFGLFISSILLFAEDAQSPESAQLFLSEGNKRFVEGKLIYPNVDSIRRAETDANGQHPFATILACSDSRVPVEFIFDRGIGDLFIVKVAGNVMDTDEIGTIEYGIGHLHTPLLVVLGHSKCGAVTAVCKGDKVHGSIPKLVDNIIPVVENLKKKGKSQSNPDFVNHAINDNVFKSIEDLYKQSEEARNLVKEGKLKIVGALYDINSGKVEWLGHHPNEQNLLKLTSTNSSEHQIKAQESSFFSSTNNFFMVVFIIICSLVSGIVIFIILFLKAGKKA